MWEMLFLTSFFFYFAVNFVDEPDFYGPQGPQKGEGERSGGGVVRRGRHWGGERNAARSSVQQQY
jgi:hypothetical protein